jgi:hypothetical protein
VLHALLQNLQMIIHHNPQIRLLSPNTGNATPLRLVIPRAILLE